MNIYFSLGTATHQDETNLYGYHKQTLLVCTFEYSTGETDTHEGLMKIVDGI